MVTAWVPGGPGRLKAHARDQQCAGVPAAVTPGTSRAIPMSMPILRLPRLLASVLLLALANAQTPIFRELPHLAGASAAVHDPSRDRTWFAMPGTPARLFEWDGTTVRARSGELDTLTRVLALGFEAASGRIQALAFDLQARLVRGTHDGCRWNWQATQQYLSPTSYDPIAYDSVRGRFVIYRFHTNSTSRIVEFDGTNWVTTIHPNVTWRNGPAFAFDPSVGRCVLFGGSDSTGPLADSWTWNGITFAPLTTSPGPGPRQGASFGWSSTHAGLVLYGNSLPGTTDTWLLTGATWTQLQSTYDAGWFSQPVLVDDGMGLVLVGLANHLLMSGRRLLGSTWAPVPGLVAPPYRQRAAVGFDRRNGELVAFGGTQEDIEVMQVFDGRWHQVQPTLAPARRSGAGLVWSAVDNALLMHGGSDANGVPLTDTWTWNGSTWRHLTPPTSPPPRLFGAFASDPAGGVLLYGGFAGSARADHWRWNGTTWQQVAAAAAPGAVFGALAALDEVRQRTVLLGVFPGSALQTWEWDGLAWTLRDASSHPPLASGCRMAFDPARGQVTTLHPAVQAWNGSLWQSVPYAGQLPNIQALVSDTRRGGLLVLGSSGPVTVTTLTTQPATGTVVGSACALVDPPSLVALELPALGLADFALDLGTLAPGAPCMVWFGVGGPGTIGPCAIATGPTLGSVFATTDAGGNALLPLPIPDDRSLLGFSLLAQGAVFDPARSPIGNVTLSAGLALAIGW